MDLDFIIKNIEAQGFVVVLLCAMLWFVVKAYGKMQDKMFDMQKENSTALIDVIKTNTAAWQKVEEKLNASNH